MINYLGLLAVLFVAVLIFKKGTVKSDLSQLFTVLQKVQTVILSKVIADSRREKVVLAYALLMLKCSLRLLLNFIPFGALIWFLEFISGGFLELFTSMEGVVVSVVFIILFQLVSRYFAAK